MERREKVEEKFSSNYSKKAKICENYLTRHPELAEKKQAIVFEAWFSTQVTPRQLTKILKNLC